MTDPEQLSLTAPPSDRPDGGGQGLLVGVTLSCRECGVRGVVLDSGVSSGWPTCHGWLTVASPVPCEQRTVRAEGDAMIAGRLYADLESGFVLRCTWGGRGQVMISGRTLQACDRRDVLPGCRGRGGHGLSRELG